MLTKQPLREFVMGTPGRPGVPERTVCTPPYSPPPPRGISGGGSGGGGGGGSQVCTSSCMVLGTDPETGGPMYLCGVPVCRPG